MKFDINVVAHIYQHGELEEQVKSLLAYAASGEKDHKKILLILDQLLNGGTEAQRQEIFNKLVKMIEDVKTTI